MSILVNRGGLNAAFLAISLGSSAAMAADDPRAALHQAGDEILMTLHARGSQIYECRAGAGGALAWTFKAPEAQLFLGAETVGHHFAGPSWEYRDGSRITGKVAAKANGTSAKDIPWLRLDVASHGGDGAFAPVGAVLRVDTEGGALQGPCDTPGVLKNEPYQANDVFLRRP